jgi:hypothetical protein
MRKGIGFGIAATLLVVGTLLWATSSVGKLGHASDSSLAVHRLQPVW